MTKIIALDLATAAGIAFNRPNGTISRQTVDLLARAGIPASATDDEVDAEILWHATVARLADEAAALAAKPTRKRRAA